MKGFDVWKLLGDKAPRGYRNPRVAEKAAKEVLENAEKARVSNLGSLKDGPRQVPKGSAGAGDIASLLLAAGVPIATLYAAYAGTKKAKEAQR